MADLQSIADAIISKWSNTGYTSLDYREQVILNVWAYAADVDNGGMEGYFCNPMGIYATDTYTALLAIGADNHASILKRVIDLFHGNIPSDVDERTAIVEEMMDAEADLWDSSQKEFFALGSEDLYARLQKYSEPPAS